MAAAAPIAAAGGGLANGPDGGSSPGAFGDPWGDLLSAAPPSPSPSPEESPEAEERVVAADLLTAPVPSLCEHPAGTLEDGRLPGITAGGGVVWVFTDDAGRIPAGRVAYGPLEREAGGGAAVAVYCDQGGVGWPESVVLYGPGPEYLGHVVLSDLAPGRQRVESILIADELVTVRFTGTYAADESGSRGRLDGTVDLWVEDGEVVVAEPEFVDERPTAREAVRAALAGDSEALAEVATSDAATELLRRVEEARAAAASPAPSASPTPEPTPQPDPTPSETPSDTPTHTLPPGELGVGQCTSPLAGAPDGTRATCTLIDSNGVVANMHLSRLGFATWQVLEVAAPPTETVAG